MVSTFLTIAGLAATVAGFYLIHDGLAIAAAGLIMLRIAFTIEDS